MIDGPAKQIRKFVQAVSCTVDFEMILVWLCSIDSRNVGKVVIDMLLTEDELQKMFEIWVLRQPATTAIARLIAVVTVLRGMLIVAAVFITVSQSCPSNIMSH